MAMRGRIASGRETATALPLQAIGADIPDEPPGVQARAAGLVGLYAGRVLDRGGDLRALAADARAARCGPTAGADRVVAPLASLPARPVGRGTDRHRQLMQAATGRGEAQPRRTVAGRSPRGVRRVAVAAGVAALVMLPIGALLARAAEPTPFATAFGSQPAGMTRLAGPPPIDKADAGVGRIARVSP
jgi:hypothetical protein